MLGHGASSTAAGGIAIGSGGTVTTPDSCQLGPAVVSGAATFSFRTQIISDESWIGGGSSLSIIDNNGNISRVPGGDVPATGTVGDLYTVSTTDATPTVIKSYTPAANSVQRITADVVGRRTNGTNETYSVRIDGLIKNDGGTITTHVTLNTQIKDVGAYVIEYNINGANVELRVTGEVGHNVDWKTYILQFAN